MPGEHERAMTMLTTALEMEEKGKKFYDDAAVTCKNKVGREIYELLSKYEVEHVERIQQIYDGLTKGLGWKEDTASFAVTTDLGEAFRKLAASHKETKADADDVQALGVGIEFESASVKFYEEHLGESENEIEKKFLEAMVAEERGHLNLLSDMKFYYTDPAAWLMEKERAGLDGA